MKKTSILAVLLLLSASQALAGQWISLGTYGNSTRYFFNPKTFSVSQEKVVSTWTKVEIDADATAMAKEKVAPGQSAGMRTIQAFEEFDCTNRKKRTVTGMTWESKAPNDTARVNKTDWLKVATGSLDENVLNALCRESLTRKSYNQPPQANSSLPK